MWMFIVYLTKSCVTETLSLCTVFKPQVWYVLTCLCNFVLADYVTFIGVVCGTFLFLCILVHTTIRVDKD